MITSALISKYRRKYNDLPRVHEDRITDATTTTFSTTHAPIKEGTFQLYINGTLQSTGYTVDYDTGDFDLSTTTSYEIKVRYQEVNFRDQGWLEFIQDGMAAFGDRFYRGVLRSPSGITLSAGIQKYACPSSCIRLTEVLMSDSNASGGNMLRPNVNVSYDRRTNQMIWGVKPTRAGYLEISYLTRLAKPTSTASVIDMEEDWYGLLDLKVGSIQARAMADRISKQGNVSVEEGHLSVSQLRILANDNEMLFNDGCKKIKPVLPSFAIPYYIPGGGEIR